MGSVVYDIFQVGWPAKEPKIHVKHSPCEVSIVAFWLASCDFVLFSLIAESAVEDWCGVWDLWDAFDTFLCALEYRWGWMSHLLVPYFQLADAFG